MLKWTLGPGRSLPADRPRPVALTQASDWPAQRLAGFENFLEPVAQSSGSRLARRVGHQLAPRSGQEACAPATAPTDTARLQPLRTPSLPPLCPSASLQGMGMRTGSPASGGDPESFRLPLGISSTMVRSELSVPLVSFSQTKHQNTRRILFLPTPALWTDFLFVRNESTV